MGKAKKNGRAAARWRKLPSLGAVLFLSLLVLLLGRGSVRELGRSAASSSLRGGWLEQVRRALEPPPAAPRSAPGPSATFSRASGSSVAGRASAATEVSVPSLPSAAMLAAPGAATSSTASPAALGPGEPGERAPRAPLSGHVVDATGGPIAGARVMLTFDQRARARLGSADTLAAAMGADLELIADAEGAFQAQVLPGWVQLEASAEAYAVSRRSVKAPAVGIELALAPAASIHGHVESTRGEPVGGARISARNRGLEQRPIEASSDGSGQFTLGGVRPGLVELTASAPGFAPSSVELRLALAEVEPGVVLQLAPAHSVVGRVLAAGQPCAAGAVRTEGPLGTGAALDAEGRYRVDGLMDGLVSLTAACTGAAPETRELRITRNSPTSTTLDFTLGAGLSLTGSVRRLGGEPVEGARLRVLAAAPPPNATGPAAVASAHAVMGLAVSECSSDASGAFACSGLAPGYYRVAAEAPRSPGVVSDSVLLETAPPPPVQLIVADGAAVRVRVASSTGAVAPVRAAFARRDGQAISALGAPSEAGFLFEHLALGRYRVGFSRALDPLGPGIVELELTQPGQLVDVELAPPPALAISGRVVDRGGIPVVDAWVDALPAAAFGSANVDAIDPVLTNSDGVFELSSLGPGRYVVRAVHARGEARQLDVPAGAAGLSLLLDEYGSLSAVISAPDGSPAAAFSVVLVNEAGPGGLHADGSAGRWQTRWVAAGRYRLLVLSASGGAVTRVSVEPGRDTAVDVRLDPALAGVAIQNAVTR